MLLRIYDTLSRKVKEVPSNQGSVSMYCCGPTVYRDAHVGNLRTFLLSDLISRTIRLSGLNVVLIQNITDVGHMSEDVESEDKILSQAKKESLDPFQIARNYEAKFHKDLSLLNIEPAHKYPRASDSIELMLDVISELVKVKKAYIGSDESVYFDAAGFSSYGALSGNKLDSLKVGHRYDINEGDGKKFHADWALWKAAGERKEMIWNSPWGLGFPGWHIECTAMSLNLLAGHVNLHVGGIDLRFPHHENERAQSNSITGDEVVDHWVHGEHLLFEGRKMSKSAGNVVLLTDIIDRGFDPLALRFCFLENRYRSQMDLNWASLTAANTTLKRWRNIASKHPGEIKIDNQILEALYEDLDTPKAMQRLRAIEKESTTSEQEKAALMNFADQVLGLQLGRMEEVKTLPENIKLLLLARLEARDNKEWGRADQIRQEIESHGIELKDTSDGQQWSWR